MNIAISRIFCSDLLNTCTPQPLRTHPLKPNTFSRTRILSFPVLLVAMLSGFKASVQNELNAFFAHLLNQADLLRGASAQASSKARGQFSHVAFALLNTHLLRLVEQAGGMPRWHGLRVVAADAFNPRVSWRSFG